MSRRTIAAVAWTLVLLAACLLPSRWLYADESRVLNLGFFQVDKLVHGILFGLFGLLWLRAIHSRAWVKWVLAVGVMLAVGTELGQTLPLVARDADRYDVLADMVGLFVGFGTFRVLPRSLEGPATPSGEA